MSQIDTDTLYQRAKLTYGLTKLESDILTAVTWWHAGHLVPLEDSDDMLSIGTHRPPSIEVLVNPSSYIEWNVDYEDALNHLHERDFLQTQYIGRRQIRYGLTMQGRQVICNVLDDQEALYPYWLDQKYGSFGAAPLYGDRDLTVHRTALLIGVESVKSLDGIQNIDVENIHVYPSRDHPDITDTGPIPDGIAQIQDHRGNRNTTFTLAIEAIGPNSGYQTVHNKVTRRSREAQSWLWIAQSRETLVAALDFAPEYEVGGGWGEISASNWSNQRINQRENKSPDLWWTSMSLLNMDKIEFAETLHKYTSIF